MLSCDCRDAMGNTPRSTIDLSKSVQRDQGNQRVDVSRLVPKANLATKDTVLHNNNGALGCFDRLGNKTHQGPPPKPQATQPAA
jgi:hypothetical protein